MGCSGFHPVDGLTDSSSLPAGATSSGDVSCAIVASANNLVPGDSTTLTLSTFGNAISTQLNGQDFGASGGSLTLAPSASLSVSGIAHSAKGDRSCSIQIKVKPQGQLTKDELYRAAIGPNNSSIDALLTSRCSVCHSGQAGSNATASSWVIIRPQDTGGNLARLKQVSNPSTGALFSNLTQAPVSTSIWQFMSGHKTKNPAYTQADLDWALVYVNTP